MSTNTNINTTTNSNTSTKSKSAATSASFRLNLKSPANIAFGAVSLLVIVIVILVYPQATYAVIAIMGAAPAFLNALAAFIVALRSHQGREVGTAEQPGSNEPVR